MSFVMRVFGASSKSKTLGRKGLPMQTRSTATRPVRTVGRPSGQLQSAQPPSAQAQSHRGGGVHIQTSKPPHTARPTNNIPTGEPHVQYRPPAQAPTTGRPQGVARKGLPPFPGLGSKSSKVSNSAHADPPRAAVARKEPAFGFGGLPNNFTGSVHLQRDGRWDIRPDGDRRLSGVPPEAKDAVVEAMAGFTKAEQMRGIGIRVVYRFDGTVDVETHHLSNRDVARSAPAALPHRF